MINSPNQDYLLIKQQLLKQFYTTPMNIKQPSSPMHQTHRQIQANNLQPQSSYIKHDRIIDLYSKFLTINNQISIDHDLSAFNLIQYHHRDLKNNFDQQLISAKLKRLENNAELKRINMQLQNRKKKTTKHRLREYLAMPQKEKYLNTYREFTQQKHQQKAKQVQSDSQEQENLIEVKQPNGITFFSQLRKHPKVLQYTVEQLRSKDLHKKEIIDNKKNKRNQLKSQIKRVGNLTVFKMTSDRIEDDNYMQNPQKIADNIFRRLYTKRNKQRSIDEIKQIKRLSHFVDRQQMIVDGIDEKSLSKQMHKKLKEKFNDIATELYMNEKKHQNKSGFPNLRMNRTFNTIK